MQRTQVRKLVSFNLTTPDARRLSEFYERALNFFPLGAERRSGVDFERVMGVQGGAVVIGLTLGDEAIELVEFDKPGQLYPGSAVSSDLAFQHFAIVVADIQIAYQKLRSVSGWTAISTDGPEQLPASSGGVTAFKFRDPDGHPLELLAFPEGHMPSHWLARCKGNLFLGIDHSAISVSDSAASIAFYEGLGLRFTTQSLNTGPEQERLDAVKDPRVEVTAMAPSHATPHIELLSYRSVARHGIAVVRNEDVAATRLIFEVDRPLSESALVPCGLIDPDGHRLVMTPTSVTRIPANSIRGD